MIRINLLPYRAAKKKENIRRQVSIFLLSVVGVALVVFWYNSHLKGQVKDIVADISNTQADIAKYDKINKEIAEIKRKLKVLETKIQVIKTLEQNRRLPIQTMDALYTNLIQSRMWYTSLQERGQGIFVSGVAIDEHTVADFMTLIEKSDLFKDVRLTSVRQQEQKGTALKLKGFSINFNREQKKIPATRGQK